MESVRWYARFRLNIPLQNWIHDELSRWSQQWRLRLIIQSITINVVIISRPVCNIGVFLIIQVLHSRAYWPRSLAFTIWLSLALLLSLSSTLIQSEGLYFFHCVRICLFDRYRSVLFTALLQIIIFLLCFSF